MKGAAIVALVLVAGALLAHLLLTDPGYVAIRLGRTLFETTLPVFVMLLGGVHLVAIAATRSASSSDLNRSRERRIYHVERSSTNDRMGRAARSSSCVSR